MKAISLLTLLLTSLPPLTTAFHDIISAPYLATITRVGPSFTPTTTSEEQPVVTEFIVIFPGIIQWVTSRPTITATTTQWTVTVFPSSQDAKPTSTATPRPISSPPSNSTTTAPKVCNWNLQHLHCPQTTTVIIVVVLLFVGMIAGALFCFWWFVYRKENGGRKERGMKEWFGRRKMMFKRRGARRESREWSDSEASSVGEV